MAKKNGKVKEDKSFEEKLWDAAEKLRGPLEYPQYKYVILPLLFLKFASDTYQKRRNYLEKETKNPDNKEYYQKTSEAREFVINDPDEYYKESVLFIKKGNTWNDIMKMASQENLGIKIDKILNDIELSNRILQGVLPKNFAALDLPNENIAELVNLFSTVKVDETKNDDFDFLGRMYEFFLGKFSSKEGKGEFYTPRIIVKIITNFIEPTNGKIFDPTCGSGGMFVQSSELSKKENNLKNNITIYGQEFTQGIWQICKMNLILRGIDTTNIQQGDSLVNDKHVSLKANFIMANPPFNMKEWGYEQLKNDERWEYGLPTDSKPGGNYAFMQHMLSHLDRKNGKMGLVLAKGSLTAADTEGKIRQKIIETDLVDCIITLPPKLFFTVTIPVCLWFFTSNKNDKKSRKRNGETLFIHAENLFEQIKINGKTDRAHNTISEENLKNIFDAYYSYVGKQGYSKYKDISGFCKRVTKDEIAKHNYFLTPGRYVGQTTIEQDEKPFEEKMAELVQDYSELIKQSNKKDKEIRDNLRDFGFEI